MFRSFFTLAVIVSLALAWAPAAMSANLSWKVVDAATGRTLLVNQGDQSRYPASLTKMMTLYLLYDALARGTIKMSTRMRVSHRAASMPPSKLGVRPGTSITVHDAILALTTISANDVAVVVAERLAGSETQFARQMTRRARTLGMHRTTFRNASGLDHPQQKSTASDMALLGRALVRDHPQRFKDFTAQSFVHEQTRYYNHNRLLATYPGADGIKTGFTRAAGYNLVASARRGNARLIGVVMGSPSSTARAMLMTNLLDQGFQVRASMVVTSASKRDRQNEKGLPVRAPLRFAKPAPRSSANWR